MSRHVKFVISLALAIAGAAGAAEQHPALSPEESMKRIQLEEGLRIELVAAEPLIVNPVAFAFEPDGRMYVVEGRAYPDPVEAGSGESTLGRIALLTDTDGDGRYDKRTEFASGLGYVNGIMLWRGGLFVTAAPNILYLKDADGDGIADEKKIVLTGFEATKTAQLRVSHPTLGFDGKVYVTSGLNGGKVTSPLHPEREAVSFVSRDGRFDPDTFAFENTGGRAQYGLAFDPYGRRFITSNRHPVLQVMLEPWHLARNPNLAFSDTTQEVSKVEAEAKVFPISRATIAADFIPKLMAAPHNGTFTSASGTVVFGGTALTPGHVGNVFICEPAQNLVQRQVLRPEGASLRSDLPYRGKEFLASSDVWFRPVFAGAGPDGALYIADMGRREIDHPRYIPEESRGLLDFESGKDRGRLYRIVKADAPRGRVRAAKPAEATETTAELVAGLESPDEWWRARAQRLLLERVERVAVPAVEKIALSGKLPQSRARALWTLRGIGGLSATTVAAALRDPYAGVREQAVQLASEMAAKAPELKQALVTAAGDTDARVRFLAALALGSIEGQAAVDALAAIAARDGEDKWTRAAVLSGIGSRMAEFLRALQARRSENPKAFAVMMEHLGRVFGAGAMPEACRELMAQMLTGEGDLSWRLSTVLGVIEGYRARGGGKAAASKDPMVELLGPEGRKAAKARTFFEAAAARAVDSAAPTGERGSAVSLLGYTDFDFAGEKLGALLDARQPPELQLQAVRALERIGDARGGALLIAKDNWSRFTPQIREAAIATLTSKPALIDVLFGAVKAGVVKAPEISSTRRTQLLKHANAKVKAEAEAIFKDLEGGDRMEIYRKYRDGLDAKADPAKGKEVFTRACSACHMRSGVGGKVGPDLTGVRNQPADALLLHIIVPNYEVYPSYQTLSVTTQDGRAISGWLAAETESSLTLRTAFGTEESVLRKSIASLAASGLSLMPDGLEQAMTKEEVSSLIAFLKSGN
ncbi:MAG: PVC-type heme-binding CxxCH protein [Verrucomicrobiota bacterium]